MIESVERETDSEVRTTRRIAGWLVILGLAHALPVWFTTAAELATSLLGARFSIEDWWRVIRSETDPEAVWFAWPVLLGAIAWRWPRREWWLAMVVAVATQMVADLTWAVDFAGMGIRRPRWLGRFAARVGHGAGLLALLGGVAGWIWMRSAWAGRVSNRRRRLPPSRPEAVAGRMAALGSLVFAGAAATGAMWIGFEELALRSAWLRAQLGTPVAKLGGYSPNADPFSPRIAEGLGNLRRAAAAATRDQFAEAQQSYARGLAILEQVVADDPKRRDDLAPHLALGFNNLAWSLATCPDESRRDPERAVRFARRSLDLAPDDGNTWNTLGVALYRAGDDNAAREAFARSMALRQGGTPHDWYFLAMLAARSGRSDEARSWLERARRASSSDDAELDRFDQEAERVFERERLADLPAASLRDESIPRPSPGSGAGTR